MPIFFGYWVFIPVRFITSFFKVTKPKEGPNHKLELPLSSPISSLNILEQKSGTVNVTSTIPLWQRLLDSYLTFRLEI